jgi:hypothetical protein
MKLVIWACFYLIRLAPERVHERRDQEQEGGDHERAEVTPGPEGDGDAAEHGQLIAHSLSKTLRAQ